MFLVVPVVTLLFCFSGVLIHVLMEARRAALERAGETAARLIAALSSDISRNIEILDLSLQAVVDDLKNPKIDHIDPELRQLLLFDRSATARHLGRMLVIDESGNLRIDSRTLNPQSRNFADRDYFQAHKNSDDIGTYIGRPERARDSGKWFIGISRRLSHADGSFAGVVAASLRLSFFEELFKDVALGRNGNVTLARTDRTLITQWPPDESYIGLDLSRSALYPHLAQSQSGVFETDSVTDGVHRLVAYGQVGDLPLVIGLGQSMKHVYANWRRNTRSITVLVTVLCVMTVLLAIYLSSELTRRESAERDLAMLQMSDGLTGLLNRRFFDEVLDREWRRCRRARLPAAVLMIDVDFFGVYNDANGDRAGDALLKTLGKSIAAISKRAGDWGARYGGDEFAIFLSGASAAEAETVCRLLRQRFADECVKNGISAAGLSIGIAAAAPNIRESPDRLVEAADQAVHLAKQRGRGRTEMACRSHDLTRAA